MEKFDTIFPRLELNTGAPRLGSNPDDFRPLMLGQERVKIGDHWFSGFQFTAPPAEEGQTLLLGFVSNSPGEPYASILGFNLLGKKGPVQSFGRVSYSNALTLMKRTFPNVDRIVRASSPYGALTPGETYAVWFALNFDREIPIHVSAWVGNIGSSNSRPSTLDDLSTLGPKMPRREFAPNPRGKVPFQILAFDDTEWESGGKKVIGFNLDIPEIAGTNLVICLFDPDGETGPNPNIVASSGGRALPVGRGERDRDIPPASEFRFLYPENRDAYLQFRYVDHAHLRGREKVEIMIQQSESSQRRIAVAAAFSDGFDHSPQSYLTLGETLRTLE